MKYSHIVANNKHTRRQIGNTYNIVKMFYDEITEKVDL